MKRKIKFRAWDKTEKRMWFNVQKAYDWIAGRDENNGDAIPATDFDSVLDDMEVMQFTGLLDSEGKEIYEGDILLDDSDGESFDSVEWSKTLGGWTTHDWYGPKEFVDMATSHQIIGDIYSSPELLTSPLSEKTN